MSYKKEIVWKPRSSMLEIDLKELWDYRDLVIVLINKHFKLVYKQTILGPLWLVINPILTSVIFTFVFGNFAGIPTDNVPPFLFYVAGSTIWNLFSNAVKHTSTSFVHNKHLFTKIYFPRIAAPLAMVINSLLNYFIQLAALFVFFIFYMVIGTDLKLTPQMLLVFPLAIQTIMLALGVGLISSALTAKYRDFTMVIDLVMNLWMYVTPVVYPISLTGGLMNLVLKLNPMTAIVSNFKWAFLGSGSLMIGGWIWSLFLTVVILYIGIVLFSWIDKNFADNV